MGLRVGGFSLVVMLRSAVFYDKSLASGMVCWEEYDVNVDGFFLVPLGYTCSVFMFSKTLLSLCSFFISLQLQVASKQSIFDVLFACWIWCLCSL